MVLYPAHWVKFQEPNIVVIFSGKVELGQGLTTAFRQLAAHELHLSIEQINLVSGDTRCCPDEGVTAGSLSIEVGGGSLRRACAAIRERFRQAAAKRLADPVEDIEVQTGFFRGRDCSQPLSYWDLAEEVDLFAPIEIADITLRSPCPKSPLGRPIQRDDLINKISTKAFIHDLQIPEMVHARVVRPRAPMATLSKCDEKSLSALEGVIAIVRDGSFLAVVCTSEHQAINAAEQAPAYCVWQPVTLPPMQSIFDALRDENTDFRTVKFTGSSGVTQATHTLERRYSRPFLAHASIGPCCAVASESNGVLNIWSHTQSPFTLRNEIATVLGREQLSVAVIHQPGAGCYGHNGADDVALDAALIASAIGRPVRVVWSRQDELSWAPFGAAMAVNLRASVNSEGCVVHWEKNIYSYSHVSRPGTGDGIDLLAARHLEKPFPLSTPRDFPPPAGGGDRNAIPIYDFSHQDIRYHFAPSPPFRVSAIRSLGAFANTFAIESMMDDLAYVSKKDPLNFRLAHLSDQRACAVLNAAAQRFGWGEIKLVQDSEVCRGRGMAVGRYKNTAAYFAIVVEVDIAESLRVVRAVAAVDAGLVVNPDGLINQIEGGIIQAISWTLLESVRWDENGLLLNGWEDYPILGFDQIPEIDVIVLNQPELPSLGVGECAAGPTAGAIGNALFQGLGVRATHLPLTAEAIANAMG